MSKLDQFDRREYDLDWIRVLATLVVFLYHCFMFVNPFPWHIKNNVLDSGVILVYSLFLGAWVMPIFFMVSGLSVSLAMRKRKTIDFVKERFLRLGVPLLVGIFILSPPQIYIERISLNQFKGSFYEFFPEYFDGLYLDIGQTGNFAFHGLHLWYLLVLLVFSLVLAPVIKVVKNKVKFKSTYLILFPILLFLSGILNTVKLGGWDLVFYFVIFVFAYFFFTNDDFKPALKAAVRWHLPLGILTSIIFISWFIISPPSSGTYGDVIFFAVRTLSCYSWLICLFYFANKYLSFSNSFLRYSSEASMPFYVLHQPVIVIFGFMIRDLSWTVPLKLTFLIVVSFMTIMIIYHVIIRNFTVLRFLFGMKQKPSGHTHTNTAKDGMVG